MSYFPGLYFSAHWCPPCRRFTPELVNFYNKVKSGPLAEQLEIVFISYDRDEKSYDDYYDSMPWLTIPFDEREIKVKRTNGINK